jgi:hypothetical protein
VTTDLPLADVALAAQVVERIGRLSGALQRIQRSAQRTWVRVESANRDVVLSVDRDGRLVSLWLAPGSTARLTSAALEALINDTLSTAVDLALGRGRRYASTATANC